MNNDKTQAAKRRAAITLSRKLNEAAKATNAFIRACNANGEPLKGDDDGRLLLVRTMMEYANHLDAVFGERP
jgi:DNA-binding transcriptional regulator/RsmH inhibitor MraZ